MELDAAWTSIRGMLDKIFKKIESLFKDEPITAEFLGRLEGTVKIAGDIESPGEPPEAWDCMRDTDS
jgi:hypothetical protein